MVDPVLQDSGVAPDEFYIAPAVPPRDERTQVLKSGEMFGVFDRYGNIQGGDDGQGLYWEGTRFLSHFVLRVNGETPLLLSSSIKEENNVLLIDLTNPDLQAVGGAFIPRGTLHIFRSTFLWGQACYQRFKVVNYGERAYPLSLVLDFASDYHDIFEVRGLKREQQGEVVERSTVGKAASWRYRGLDSVERSTVTLFDPSPNDLRASRALFVKDLAPKEEWTVYVTVQCHSGMLVPTLTYDAANFQSVQAIRASAKEECEIHSSNDLFNAWVIRSHSDLRMMTTQTPQGPYPYAGVPWFSAPFGRDGILTALECLWVNPSMAKGVLGFLAATQATQVVPEQDAEPGKILHECRQGEMANLKEIPFGRYYGSVDSTPLFVILAGAYHEWTGDKAFIKDLWPHVQAALTWIDRYGDVDRDGFVEYQRHATKGLTQQGWKDSHNSVFHEDGRPAEAPIALCEVQGYVYLAKKKAATMAQSLGFVEEAHTLARQAEELRKRFDSAFWCEEKGTYALALDGQKQPCNVRTSNPGQCLFTGIVPSEKARRVADALLDPSSFSGWGIRTLDAREPLYNPMSYHNGSVWPHDNALIALGLGVYGFKTHVLRLVEGFLEASNAFDHHRMPELFCGFSRRSHEGPTLYPVACSPQSWAAGAVYMFLQALLGLSIDGARSQLSFVKPVLPPYLTELRLINLPVGAAHADLLLTRYSDGISVNILRCDESINVRVLR